MKPVVDRTEGALVTRIALVSLVALAIAATGCSAAEQPTDPPASVDTTTAAPSSPAATTEAPASPSASPSAAESTPSTPAREVPASCASLTLEPGATLKGSELGACVADALKSYGSGRMHMLADDLDGTVEFTYKPDYAFHLDAENSSDGVELTYVDGTMWVDTGDGPVRGDPKSSDQAEQLAGVAGEMYRIYSDPAMTADLISSSALWRVDPLEQRDLPDGTPVQAYRISNGEPFAWHEIPVQEFIVWFGPEWVPVGAQGTLTLGEQSATMTQTFFDLGADITITAPA